MWSLMLRPVSKLCADLERSGLKKRIAVLGSNSFSGNHFAAQALRGGYDVLGISRAPEISYPFRRVPENEDAAGWRFEQVNLNDFKHLARALHDFQPDFVVNFAAQSMVAESWKQPEDWYRTNVLGIAGLSRILLTLSTLRNYVHVTTPEVYGSTDGWVKESWRMNPSTPYAISRTAGDLHMRAMHEQFDLPVSFTRAANVFGPGQQLYRLIPRALLYARLGRRLRLDGGGSSTRSFIHVDDVVRATLQVMLQGSAGSVYHVSTDEIVSVREVVELVCRLTGAEFGTWVDTGPDRPGKDATYMLDSTRLKNDLSWSPKYSLEEGIRDTLAWIDTDLEVLATSTDEYLHRE